MDDKRMDEMIQDALIKGTESSAEMQDKVWSVMQKHRKENRRRVIKMAAKRKRRRNMWLGAVSAAAALVLVFLIGTEPGQAAVNKVRKLLAPEKVIVEELEGQKEDTKASLNESQIGYVIYFDKERYSMEKLEGKDRIVPKAKGTEDLPEVYMEIQQAADQTPETMKASMEEQLLKQYPLQIRNEKVSEPLNGYVIQVQGGEKWNDAVVKVYLVSNGEGGTFIIKQQYFVEASEGHGVRFDNMLKEFRITKEIAK